MPYEDMIQGPCYALTEFSFRNTHQRPIMHLIQNPFALGRRRLPESAGYSRPHITRPWANFHDDAVTNALISLMRIQCSIERSQSWILYYLQDTLRSYLSWRIKWSQAIIQSTFHGISWRLHRNSLYKRLQELQCIVPMVLTIGLVKKLFSIYTVQFAEMSAYTLVPKLS
jgi:hypothetical protein